jgi:hypothetical protein
MVTVQRLVTARAKDEQSEKYRGDAGDCQQSANV